jgi:hypothetical protein
MPFQLALRRSFDEECRNSTILLTLAAVFAAVCFAADVNIGTWKLNDRKSKNVSDEKNFTMVIAAAGGSVKVTEDGIDDKGKPWHDEWTGKFDGKDYPVTVIPTTTRERINRSNDHTLA